MIFCGVQYGGENNLFVVCRFNAFEVTLNIYANV